MLSTKRLTIRLPEQTYNELRVKAEKEGNPVTTVIRRALNEYLFGRAPHD
jgi:predicted DNA binding CopG/RHH family protein